MLKLIHAADFHLDAPFAALRPAACAARRALCPQTKSAPAAVWPRGLLHGGFLFCTLFMPRRAPQTGRAPWAPLERGRPWGGTAGPPFAPPGPGLWAAGQGVRGESERGV